MRKTRSMTGGSQLHIARFLKILSTPLSIESDSSLPCSQKLASETYPQSIRTVIKIHLNNILSSTPDVLEYKNY